MDERQKELSKHRIKEADEAFKSGKALLKIDDYRGAINRFYYAAYYATQSLLILKGKDARTHSGNLYLFREEFIKTGQLPPETNGLLSNLLDERIESDYGPLTEPTREEAASAAKNCESFLKQARKIFDALL